MSRIEEFRTNLAARRPLVGTWVKTPSQTVVEILAGTALNVLCLDAEHAPFDRAALDAGLFACRALDMPALVRVPSADPHQILNALDLGAAGVIVPHVRSVESGRVAAAVCRFGPGGRGYAGSTRAAGYTRRSMAEHLARSADETVVVAQIEDAEAVDAIEGIAALEGIDALFIGTADLAVSLGAATPRDAIVVAAAERVCAAGSRVGRPLGIFVGTLDDIQFWADRGVSLFLLQSDQTFLQAGAAALVKAFANRTSRGDTSTGGA